MRHAIGPCSGTSSARKAYLLEIAGPTHLPSLEGDFEFAEGRSHADGIAERGTWCHRNRHPDPADFQRLSDETGCVASAEHDPRTPDSPMTCLANAPCCSPIPTASASFGPGVRRSGWLPGEVQQTSFGAYLVGVGVMQGIEDPQGVSPGITGLARISGVEMDVAEVGENLGFEERIADECAGQAQGVLVAEGCRATQGCGCWIRCSAPPTCRFGPCRSWVTH
jgi:hypothetical protein